MTNTLSFFKKEVIVAVSFFALFAVLMLPAFASAASYAYVNTSGEVRTVEAASPATAINTAPGISLHSGVILLINLTDGIVGDNVSGT